MFVNIKVFVPDYCMVDNIKFIKLQYIVTVETVKFTRRIFGSCEAVRPSLKMAGRFFVILAEKT